jgi:hypothetical protein
MVLERQVVNKNMKTLLAQQSIGTINGMGNFNPVESGGDKVSAVQIDEIFSAVVTFLTIVAGLSFLIYFLIGGLNWVTAGGNEKKVDEAKSYMTNGAIGLITIIAAYSIVSIVGKVLGLDILNPGKLIYTVFN